MTAYSYPKNVFVTTADDIYVATSYTIYAYRLNSTGPTSTLHISGGCRNLFIDRNNSLYCSSSAYHQVTKQPLNSSNYQTTIVAGTGCSGFFPDRLYNPNGIFVHTNFDVYVADSGNHRIQKFPSGKLNGITVVGKEAPGTITLRYPTDVILDADGHLFIVDRDNHRIVGSGSFGFRCIVGCTGTRGSASDQLFRPQSIAFDSYGNILVVDGNNHRAQKFLLATNSCSEYDLSYS